MNRCVPSLPVEAGTKRWWDKSTLQPLKAEAQHLLCHYQRHRDKPSWKAYLDAAHAYRDGIHSAKRQHWRYFLDSLTPSTLFTALKYATSAFSAPAVPVPPLQTAAGILTSDPDQQADLLFHGTSAPTVPCKLDDLLPAPP